MSAAAQRSMLGLVELVDAELLEDVHGAYTFARLREDYLERLRQWIRGSDHWRLLGDNRFCVVLNGVSSPAELELATAKLARVFEPPHLYLGRSVPLEVTAGFAAMEGDNLENDIAIRQASMALEAISGPLPWRAREDPTGSVHQVCRPVLPALGLAQ